MKEDLNVLNNIHKGLIMGMESISVLSSKVEDNHFQVVLEDQYKQYNDILKNVNSKFSELGKYADDTTGAQKAMGWMNLQLNTFNDHSNSNLSDVLIRGTTMGIIEGRKMLNNHYDISDDVKNILNTFVSKQEHDIEKLKEWL